MIIGKLCARSLRGNSVKTIYNNSYLLVIRWLLVSSILSNLQDTVSTLTDAKTKREWRSSETPIPLGTVQPNQTLCHYRFRFTT
jgi:hypothetical protein